MLKQLRLKNWRSVRDATIDFTTPITVLIGANSSGKTNILDALRFLQYSHTDGNRGIVRAIRYKWGGKEKIHTVGVPWTEPTEISFAFQPHQDRDTLAVFTNTLNFYQTDAPLLNLHRNLKYGTKSVEDDAIDLPMQSIIGPTDVFAITDETYVNSAISHYVSTYITRRWQIFKELFVPQLNIPSESDPGDLYVVEENGHNIAFILDNMRFQRPDLYARLQEDISWLLDHVKEVDSHFTDKEISITIREKLHSNIEAPSVSAGTGRLIAMLTAIYALDIETNLVRSSWSEKLIKDWVVPINTIPGLVVIEEPDTALNPGVLSNFVEQLRIYAEGDRRQFILTTHNPRFLDYFKPDEVRVVSRGMDGYTKVERIPDHIDEVWLDDHTLGEVWMTRSLGGLPE